MSANVSQTGNGAMLPPTRLASRTPSHGSSQGSVAGQQQWQSQCNISSERMSAYSNAQKLWARLDPAAPAAVGDPTLGYDELTVEIAMRGKNRVLEGIAKGARTAFKNWRATVGSVTGQGRPISSLFAEYENAIADYRRRAEG